jgi:hypothetical protein
VKASPQARTYIYSGIGVTLHQGTLRGRIFFLRCCVVAVAAVVAAVVVAVVVLVVLVVLVLVFVFVVGCPSVVTRASLWGFACFLLILPRIP